MDDLKTMLDDFLAKRDDATRLAAEMAAAKAAADAATDASNLASQQRDVARRALIDAINRA
jgi:hypothetical protein